MEIKTKKQMLEAAKALGKVSDELYQKASLYEKLSDAMGNIECHFIESFINKTLGIDDYVSTYKHQRHESGMFMVDRLYEIVLHDGIWGGRSSKYIQNKLKTAVMCSQHEVSE